MVRWLERWNRKKILYHDKQCNRKKKHFKINEEKLRISKEVSLFLAGFCQHSRGVQARVQP